MPAAAPSPLAIATLEQMHDPRAEYTARLTHRQSQLLSHTGVLNRIGLGRLATFIALCVLAWSAFSAHTISAWWLLAPIAILVALISAGQRVNRSTACTRRGLAVYQRGLERLDDDWAGHGETGERFADPNHVYAADLDLFGPGSLFELLSAARTRAGENTLAHWLLAPASADEIQARQSAVAELRPLLDLREDLAVLGEDFRSGVHPEALAAWAVKPPLDVPRSVRVIAAVLSAAGIALVLAFIRTLFVEPHIRVAIVLLGIVEFAFVFRYRSQVGRILSAVEEPGHDLKLLSQVLHRLELHTFESSKLVALRAELDVEGRPASQRIARLHRLVELIDSRDNLFVRVFGPMLLWDTQLAFAVEAWRRVSGPHVPHWLDVVGELEALSSLAGYAYEHPADPFPEIVSNTLEFDAEEILHPLLPASRAVSNSVRLDARRRLIILSGSNMSGKSTLLRTIGVNAALAFAGAPVRARALRISPLHVGASIRTNDSLREGASRFYAEITRLKRILDLPHPVLFLLDELLHGTNSHDRRIGAEGILRSLLERGAIGLITTHDLALSGIAVSFDGAAANFHFEDHIENGRISFDYRLRPGVVEKSNALELMRAVGLEV